MPSIVISIFSNPGMLFHAPPPHPSIPRAELRKIKISPRAVLQWCNYNLTRRNYQGKIWSKLGTCARQPLAIRRQQTSLAKRIRNGINTTLFFTVHTTYTTVLNFSPINTGWVVEHALPSPLPLELSCDLWGIKLFSAITLHQKSRPFPVQFN